MQLFTLTQVNQTLQTQPDSPLKAAGLRHLGNALRLIGDLNESRKVLQQSLEVAEKLPSPPDFAAALLSLGNTARAQQQAEAALQFYQRAAATEGSPTTRIQALVNQFNLIAEGGIQGDISSLTQPLLPQIQTQLADLPLGRIGVYARINLAQSLMMLAEGRPKKEEKTPASPVPLEASQVREIGQILATAIQQASTLGDQQAQALRPR